MVSYFPVKFTSGKKISSPVTKLLLAFFGFAHLTADLIRKEGLLAERLNPLYWLSSVKSCLLVNSEWYSYCKKETRNANDKFPLHA